MIMIKHIHWENKNKEQGGILGLKRDEATNKVTIASLRGNALPVEFLLSILNAGLKEGWEKEAEKLHLSRKNPWLVSRYVSTSGAEDYYLTVLSNPVWKYVYNTAHIHISMYGKLNEDLNLWLGDIPPLLNEILKNYNSSEPDYIYAYTPTLNEHEFIPPSTPSGLLETIESIKALKTLSNN
ncbi:hypothetical protein [Thermoanaerobacterium butyriciformans]|uniref:Uncharacterized protein n=1 Tax=Thermoanaerobacterium butyriciformans TaxID=1702242 RepID=A0ABS4NAT7_9THEO|nr:hypothetical protein [Thermoanaerobacterium butyriciformans]MBP2070773.1 hypothetical protein [Thermoanaerobacterium butyriciformans]